MNFKTKHKNIFILFLELLRVRHTRSYSCKLYNEHPLRDSLLGISKMLSEYGIENQSLFLQKQHELSTLETPFIAHLKTQGFVIIEKITPDRILYKSEEGNKAEAIDVFYKKWSNVVLLAEADENSIEPGYKAHRKQELFEKLEKTAFVFIIGIFVALSWIANKPLFHYSMIPLLIINIAGAYIGYLLILRQLDIRSTYGDMMCYMFKKSNCNDILQSGAAKFMGLIGWSEVGISYFISNTLLILFAPGLIYYLALINICALPYSFWSIWYQKYRAKVWCPLCLAVQLLLWLLFINNLLSGYIKLPDFTPVDLITTGCLYVFPFLLISLLIPMIGEYLKKENEAREFRKMKLDPYAFKALLSKQEHYQVDKSTSKLIFGNKEAGTLITVVSNPFCEGCRKAHTQLDKLLKFNGEDICIQYIFTSIIDDVAHSCKFLISAYMYAPDHVEEIFRKWFSDVDGRNGLFLEYTHPIEEEEVSNELETHESWVKKSNLHSTPTILINGYRLPPNYTVHDLVFLTYALSEKQ